MLGGGTHKHLRDRSSIQEPQRHARISEPRISIARMIMGPIRLLSRIIYAPRLVAALLGTAVVSGCAGADYRPVVDMRGHSEAAYDRDLAACQQVARAARNSKAETENAGIGAAAGGAGGALLGAIGGNALLGAGVGALAGLAGTAGYAETQTETREERIVRHCMRVRGYTILG
jgi:hypothetical protein